MTTTTQDPYRFKESTQETSESDRRVALQRHFESSPLSNMEKLYNFTRFVPRAILTRFLSRMECFKKVLEIQGSVVECGVLFGSSLLTWARASSIFEPQNSQRRVIGFDTFEGFPDLSRQDKTGTGAESHVGGFDIGDSGVYEDLLESIAHFDADRQLGHIPKVEILKGNVAETIPAYLEENPHTLVSLLHLDVDIYEPTKIALEHFLPRMPRGAVIVFDELNAKAWPGETIALQETVGVRDLRIQRFSWDTYLSYAVLD